MFGTVDYWISTIKNTVYNSYFNTRYSSNGNSDIVSFSEVYMGQQQNDFDRFDGK